MKQNNESTRFQSVILAAAQDGQEAEEVAAYLLGCAYSLMESIHGSELASHWIKETSTRATDSLRRMHTTH